uniref:PAX-interacting protein 1 n=1 Tax=Plectus sambesii TaxID=2011161 RepID=A0A914XLS9_9BILA
MNFLKLRYIGGSVTGKVSEASHVIGLDLSRTVKLLEAIALGKFVVSPAWVLHSYKQGHFLDAIDYFIKDHDNEQFFGYNVKLSVVKARQKRLFENMLFYLTPSVQPSKAVLHRLINAAGGKVLAEKPLCSKVADCIERDIPLAVIGCENDAHLCQSLVECGIPIFLVEFIMTGILRQEIDNLAYRLDAHKVNNAANSMPMVQPHAMIHPNMIR